jgi:hypothetical protein
MAQVRQRFHLQPANYEALENQAVTGKFHEARWNGARLVTDTYYGEIVTFFTGPNNNWDSRTKTMDMKIGEKLLYMNINELLSIRGFKQLLPHVETFEEAVQTHKTLRFNSSGIEDGFMVAVVVMKV